MRVRESLPRDLLRLAVWYPFRWVTERLPPRAALAAFRALGDLHWLAARAAKRRLARNLQRMGVEPGPARDAAVRENFRTHYVSQLLVFVYPRLTRGTLGGLAGFEGVERLDAALAAGRGAVLVQAHMGPEQLALAALALRGHRALQIGCLNEAGLSSVGRAVALRLRRRYEARIPGEMLDARAGMLPALRVLRENGLVLCAGDGSGWADRLGGHVPVAFLGHTALFPTGAARMALGSGAALLPLFVTRGRETPYTVVIEEPLLPGGEPEAGPGLEGRAAALADAFARRCEARLLREPGSMRYLELFEPGGLIVPGAPNPGPGGTPPASAGPCAPS